MTTLVNGSAILLPVLYTFLLVALAQRFLDRGRGLVAVRRLLIGSTVAVQLAALVARASFQRACPVTAQSEILSLVALTVLLVFVVLEEWPRRRIAPAEDSSKSCGVFVVAVAFVAQCGASLLAIDTAPVTEPLPFWPSLHVFTGVIGISAVAVASVYGLLYLFLYRALKVGRFGLFYQRMPDLETLGRTNYQAVVVAFIAVSLTVAGGAISWAQSEPLELNYVRVGLTLALWVLYGALIIGHLALRFGGKRLAYSTVLGSVLALSILVVGLMTAGGTS